MEAGIHHISKQNRHYFTNEHLNRTFGTLHHYTNKFVGRISKAAQNTVLKDVYEKFLESNLTAIFKQFSLQ